jgi:hypothetical protein
VSGNNRVRRRHSKDGNAFEGGTMAEEPHCNPRGGVSWQVMMLRDESTRGCVVNDIDGIGFGINDGKVARP